MKKRSITVTRKLEIIEHAKRTKNIRGTARYFSNDVYNIQPSQIRRWLKQETALGDVHSEAPFNLTVHPGTEPHYDSLEITCFAWIMKLRNAEIPVSTTMLLAKAISLDSTFKGGKLANQRRWTYHFLKRYGLSIRKATHVGQKLVTSLNEAANEHLQTVNNKFHFGGAWQHIHRAHLVNMDETAVYFQPTPGTTIHRKGDKTVSVRVGSSHNERVTVCLSVASNGGRLPPFIIFRATPGATIERSLPSFLPDNIFGACQKNAWMDDRVMKIWFEKVWMPYVADKSSSALLMDDFKVHKSASTKILFSQTNTELGYIPGGFTCVLQPVDVGIAKRFKSYIRHRYMDFMVKNFQNVPGMLAPPCPSRKDIAEWISDSWKQFDTLDVWNTFRNIGFKI